MVETFAVEAALEWKTNVPEVLRQMQRGFEDIDKLIRGVQTNLGRFASDIKELSSSSRGIGALTRALEKLKVPDQALSSVRDLAEGMTTVVREATESARAFREMAEAARSIRVPPGGGGGVGRARGSHTSALDAAMGAQMAGDAGMGLLERGFHAYADVQLGRGLAQADKRVTDAAMAQADALIARLQKQYPALTQAEGLTLFRNTMGIFGDPQESLQALPGAVRLQQLYQLAPLGRGGTGGSEVQAAEKAGDAMQAFIDPKTGKLDRGLYDKWMDFQARSYTAGGGLVDAKGWLAFARTSRSAGIGLSDRALEETQALLEMSPGRTGTAMMSAFQVFGASTSHMTNKNRAAWNKAGLLGKDGNIVDKQLYQADPFEWVWKDLVPKLAAQGVKTRDQLLAWITDHGQRGTVAGLLSDIAIGRTPITNTATKMESQDPNLVDKLVQTDVGKLAALHAAETGFLVALGKFGEGPGIALLTALANGLNSLTAWATAHPDAAARIIAVGGGLSLLAQVAGNAAMASIFIGGPLIGGVRGLAGALRAFGSGEAAGSGLAILTGAGGLTAVAGGVIALGAAVFALPPILKWLIDKTPPGTPTTGRAAPTHTGGAVHHEADGPPVPPGFYGTGHTGNMRSGAPIHVTLQGDVKLDGKKVGNAIFGGMTGNSPGMTGHDPSMSAFPGGAPAGSGN